MQFWQKNTNMPKMAVKLKLKNKQWLQTLGRRTFSIYNRAQRDSEFVQSEVMFIFARCKRFAAPAADLLSIDIGSFQMHFVFSSRYTIW